MRYSELSADITWSDSLLSKFHNSLPNNIWQWSAIDKQASELVHTTLTCNKRMN